MFEQYNHTDVLCRLDENVKRNPDKIAVYVGKRAVTYRTLFDISEKISVGIVDYVAKNRLNGKTPVRVGVFIGRNEFVEAAIISIIRLGCTYVPIDTETPKDRVAFIAQDASLSLILTEKAYKDNLPKGFAAIFVEDLLGNDSKETVTADFSTSDNEAYIIYTSGTTGKPKGAPINYTNLYYYLLTAGREDHFHIHENSVVLHYSSINFDVSIIEVYTALFYGATLVVVSEEERKDVKVVYKLINKHKVTYMSLPPTMFNLFPDYNLLSLETACAGGETMPRSLVERIGKNSFRFLNAYGPCECTPVSCVREMTSSDLWRNIGWASYYATFVVVDENMQPVQAGEEGELLIGGPQVFNGYLNRPELTREKLIDNPFADTKEKAPRLYRTGDIVRLMADGSCEFVQRQDSQIKINGHRIELGEILANLENCPDVRRAYLKVEENGSNKSIVAFILPQDIAVCSSNSMKQDVVARVQEQVKKELPDYMVPTMWNFVQDFPLTINGKIDGGKLVNTPFSYIDVESDADLTYDEKMLKQEVVRVIGFENISIDVDLFSVYGLSSIQAMQVSLDLNTLGMQISALEMYKYRTVREIIKNRDARLCYWYNDDDSTTKPVIVVLSGYTSFGYMYTQWADRLVDKYSIYVVEYYHAIIGDKWINDIEELMSAYRDMVKPIVDRYNVCCITGMCIGGEHALLLAQQLYQGKKEKPHVIIIDGEIDRDTCYETNAHLRFPFLTDDENDMREHNDFTLMRTFPDFNYEGKLSIFLSGIFVDYYSYLDPDWNDVKDAGMRKAFDTCAERWKKHYPDCFLGIMPSDHDNFWRSEPSLTILADYYINSL